MTTQMNGHKVTVRNSEVGTSEFPAAPAERETAPDLTETRNSEVTISDRIAGWVEAGREYWTTPEHVASRQPSVAELLTYAREGAWTKRLTGPLRTVGVWWCYLVAIPVTFIAGVWAWIAQRPGRALACFVLWQLLVRSAPGVWLAEHIIRPILAAAAWVLLP